MTAKMMGSQMRFSTYITSFSSDTCRIKGGSELPINIKCRKDIEQTWRNYLFNKIRGESMRRGGGQ